MRARVLSRRGSIDLRELLSGLRRSDTGRAAGMGAAMIGSNLFALLFTIVFARLLGASGYGSLAVLISAFIILMVPGSALQIAVAREVSHSLAEGSRWAGAGARRWLPRLALATAVVALLAVPLRSAIGALINVDDLWAAAAVPVAAMLWMIVSVERGVLQGLQAYRAVAFSIVGEALARIAFALALVLAGLDVTGAFLGNAVALLSVALALLVPLRRRIPRVAVAAGELPRLRGLLREARIAVVGLTLLLTLQELHVILVKHEASADAAGSYAVAAVAAKPIIWIAVGLGLYLLPEAARRSKAGADARPILLRTVGLIVVAALPMLVIYVAAGKPLLRAVFGEDLTGASGALPMLGLAMALLACTYLCVQYLLALGRSGFTWVLAAAVAVEVAALLAIGADLSAVALALLGVQALAACLVSALSLRRPAVRGPSQRAPHPIAAGAAGPAGVTPETPVAEPLRSGALR